MKICFLEGDMSRRGGTERMTSIIAGVLCEKGHEILVVSRSLENGKVFFDFDSRVTHIVLPQAKGKLGIIKHIQELRKIIKREQVDIVINVDIGMGIYGICASMGRSVKVVTWEHANYFNNWGSAIFPYFRNLL